MEGLAVRGLGVGVALTVLGLGVRMIPDQESSRKTEAWMEAQLPDYVGAYHFVPSKENPRQSYKMDRQTYEGLKPFGIVCRKYTNGPKAFDVVVIASNSRSSFHDPLVCFTAQGYIVQSQQKASFNVASQPVPYTAVQVTGRDGSDAQAMYFYKGPTGYCPDTAHLKWGMVIDRMFSRTKPDGVFYRIIPDFPGATVSDLREFAAEYKAAATQSSNGYF